MGVGVKMKSDVNPTNNIEAAHKAPRCTATSKGSGKRCGSPAVKGWKVCRLHGAGGGHKAGPTHPRWKHGARSQSAVLMRKFANEMARAAKIKAPP